MELLGIMKQACLQQLGKFAFASLSVNELIDVRGLGKEAMDDICIHVEGKVGNIPRQRFTNIRWCVTVLTKTI